MKKLVNEAFVEGFLYEHSLEEKVTGESSKNPGTEYIRGTVNIAIDETCENVIPIHYSYVAATTSKGSTNKIYAILKKIIDKQILAVTDPDCEDAASAAKLKFDTKIGLNEFINDKDELVSGKINDSGFIKEISSFDNEDIKQRATFKTDMLITSVTRHEANEEKGLSERVIVKGATFDSYRKELLPIEFVAYSEPAMNFFEALEVSSREPVFTKVWGIQKSTVIEVTKMEESAFGESSIKTFKTERKEYVITGTSKEPYAWDDEGTLLASELKEMMSDRETKIATLVEDTKERKEKAASKAKTGGGAAAKPKAGTAVKKGDFDF